MKPSTRFRFGMPCLFFPDTVSLTLCYYPIIEQDGFAVYHYLLSLSHQGEVSYQIAWVLNHLNMGMERFSRAVDLLSAMDLVVVTKSQEEYLYFLKPVLSTPQFLANPLYKTLLTKKIGEVAVRYLQPKTAAKEATCSKQFSEVFTLEGEAIRQPSTSGFDWSAFRAMMKKDQLRFADETEDVIAIYHLAEQAGWNWMETYRRAKETAVGQMISVKRLQQKQTQKNPSTHPFTVQEQALIREVKSQQVLDFFGFLKQRRKSVVTTSERQFIISLAQDGLLDEVLNVLLFYVFSKVDSANLNEKYARKLANDFLYKNISSAEEAVVYLRTVQADRKKPKAVSAKTNVPQWSDEPIQTEMTAETKAKMASLKQEMLADEERRNRL